MVHKVSAVILVVLVSLLLLDSSAHSAAMSVRDQADVVNFMMQYGYLEPKTAVHEIGHSIGVGHSIKRGAIMNAQYTGYKQNLKLHEDDIIAIQAKYGKKPVSTVPPTTDSSSQVSGPSPCRTTFDAAFYSKDGNTYFFKDHYFWTVDKNKRMLGGRKIKDFWPNFRAARVQAAYTRPDGMTVLFKGRRYWVFEGTEYIEGPKFITEYGFPKAMKRLDAVFNLISTNRKTYFFKGNKYWKYNENTKKLDSGYPKNISEAWAVPQPVDSVMTWKDSNTYFFNGLNFSKFEFHKSRVYSPEKIAQFFFNCDEEEENDKNVVSRTTVFAPLMVLLAIVSSLCNYSGD